MKPGSIHQVLAGFARGDAISHEALTLRSLCRELGFASEIYAPADRIAPEAAGECRPLGEYRQQAADIAIGHYSIASAATDIFLASPARKILIYHNITPPEFFIPFDAAIARIKAVHSYSVPEIVALPFTAGFAGYLDWIDAVTTRQ